MPTFARAKLGLKTGQKQGGEPGLHVRERFPSSGGFLFSNQLWHVQQGWAHSSSHQSSANALGRTANGEGETRKHAACTSLVSRKGRALFGWCTWVILLLEADYA